MKRLADYRQLVREVELTRHIGYVTQILGLAIEAEGPDVGIGEMCVIARQMPSADGLTTTELLAEVVSIGPGRVTLMPYGSTEGLRIGSEVVARGSLSQMGVGAALLGRIIDGFGHALDDLPAPQLHEQRPLRATPRNPLLRPRIDSILETGIRAIDGLLTIGQGQRVGIFAGSGVGKSTLLGAIVRNAQAQVRVIALIGERGREVREFIEQQIGAEGLKNTVIVVATADQPALARLRAAYAALTIAEYFREQGQHVLLTMDSVTRLAMARREVGLAAGEPPTARGYTPSVFAELPELCERCGTAATGGSITALLTVLVDGDDLNEPISDSLRAILDGHIVLSRQIANRGHYPAIDVLKSASRLMTDLSTPEQQQLAAQTIRILDVLERNRQLIDIGAYEKGSNPDIDQALALDQRLRAWLRQGASGVARREALHTLADILGMGARQA